MNIKKKKYADLDISIEYEKGVVRRGKSEKGEEWERPMYCHYGYILGTHSPDGEHLDCYLASSPEVDADVYIVHQMTPDGSKFDEDKVMLGFKNKSEAKAMYKKHMNFSPHLIGGISTFKMDHFKLMAYQASKSKCIIAPEEFVDDLKKQRKLPSGIRSPIQLAKLVSEGQFFIRMRSNKHPLDYRGYNTLQEASRRLRKLPARKLYEVGLQSSLQKEKIVLEGFEKESLKGILRPKLSVDEYRAKEPGAMVFALEVINEPDALIPLAEFLRKVPSVMNVDTSDSDTQENTSLLYFELDRSEDSIQEIEDIVYDLTILIGCKKKDFTMSFPSQKYRDIDFNMSVLKKYIMVAAEKILGNKTEDEPEETEGNV